MKEQELNNNIENLKKMKANNVFHNYIEYIVFPFYKNMKPMTRIEFDFPLTILVGKNGSGKSSTLHALYGGVYQHSCSEFWFSTEVDPIAESGDRNRFYYGYRENPKSDIKQVVKSRIKRSESASKQEDLDYWETSRPLLKDGMDDLGGKRNGPVKRDVIYIDFRSEVSAFDKVLYFTKGNIKDKKKLLRDRSKYLKRLVNKKPMKFKGQADEKVGKAYELSEKCKIEIEKILDKSYKSIMIAEHKIYKIEGISVYVKNGENFEYSEANAGSGEIAIIELVRKIENAKENTLVLLDEPEVSIHPAAQKKLKEYLIKQIMKKKLQIVISTHSPIMIEELPNEAIKLYVTNKDGKFEVKENVNYQEVFFCIEEDVADKKTIVCEDKAAKVLLESVLKSIDKNQFFNVKYYSGGADTIKTRYIPTYAIDENIKKKFFVIFDGDMYNDYVFKKEELSIAKSKDLEYLRQCVKSAYGCSIKESSDGQNGTSRQDQQCELCLKYLSYYNDNIYFLPNKAIPENIILNSNYVKNNYSQVLNNYTTINNENAKEIVKKIAIDDFGEDKNIDITIEKLAHKWSLEESEAKASLIHIINKIFG